MRQVLDRGTPVVDDPARLADVTAVGVDETAYLRATATHPTEFATGIADLSPGGRHGCSTWSRTAQHSGSVLGGRATVLAADLRACPIPELARLGRTLHAWHNELCAHFDHPSVSNGPTENLNLKIKNTKRVARGYRNFCHYRLRLLLNHGRTRKDHAPTRIRTRGPRLAA